MKFPCLSPVIVLALAFAPLVAHAQHAVQPPVKTAGDACCGASPCCEVTAIDVRTGRVSARSADPKRDFAFVVTDRAQLTQLKVGQPVFANFKTNRVSITGIAACCTIVPAAPTSAPAPPPPSTADKTTTKPTTSSLDSMKVDVSRIAPIEGTTTTAIRGVLSADSENTGGQTDQHRIVPAARPFVSMPPHSLGRSRRLKDDPAISEYIKTATWALKGFEVKTVLLAGHKYMVNQCLGMKVNAGEFALTVPDPDLRVVSDGLVLTFTIAHVAMNAFSVRLRPDPTDIIQPCHFSGVVGIGGGADNVRYELHFDPVLDVEQCRIGSMGQVHQVWRIGTLHLNPLPAAVSNLAGDMIEDSLTAFANADLVDRVVAVLNAAATNQCHK
jgi:hypothetical protein